MEYRKKIDDTLKERHGILNLLERLRHDSITLDEMEEIGSKLQKSGKRALSPLVRKLWRERNSDLISRYAYLLDYFDEEGWIGQLMQIALRRKDLDEESKAVLLAALRDYGVDICAPPFAGILAEAGSSTELLFSRLLDMGTEGLVVFMEDFLSHPHDEQLAMIAQLGLVHERPALQLLEVILWLDEPELVAAAISTLGKLRSEKAAALLKNFRCRTDGDTREMVDRSLRRLSFLGIRHAGKVDDVPPPYHAAYAGPVDNAGFRSLWFARWQKDNRLATLYLQLHDIEGMKSGWGSCGVTPKEADGQLCEIVEEEGLVRISHDYALLLIRDAIARSQENDRYLPAEFYVLRPHLFCFEDLTPVFNNPVNPAIDKRAPGLSAQQRAATVSLFDDDFFAGWFMNSARVYDFAEEWTNWEKSGAKHTGAERILEKFCHELLEPNLEKIRQRLLLNAQLMERSGRDAETIGLTQTAAATLPIPPVPCHFHPFLRRLALESIQVARDALAEGYDLREHLEEDYE